MIGVSLGLQAAGWPRNLKAAALAVFVASCGFSGDGGRGDRQQLSAAYVDPPEARLVVPSAGGVVIRGVAAPGSRVRLATPAGAVVFAVSDIKGDWNVRLGTAADVRLFGLSMMLGEPPAPQRVVQSQGYLFVLPGGASGLLRSGAGALPLTQGTTRLKIFSVDHDREGGAVVSGVAAPGEQLSVRVDGVTRGRATADRAGRFSAPLNQPLTPGTREIVVLGERATSSVRPPISVAAPLPSPPFRAERTVFGWRIDWMTPGGGLQTTLIFD